MCSHSALALRDLSVSLIKLGDVEVAAGNLANARDLFARSSSILERLAKADPHSAQAMRDLSVSLERMASVDDEHAVKWLTRAVDIRRACRKTDTTNAVVAQELAVTLFQLGQAQLQHKEQAVAAQHLAEAHQLFVSLRQRGALEKRLVPLADWLAQRFG